MCLFLTFLNVFLFYILEGQSISQRLCNIFEAFQVMLWIFFLIILTLFIAAVTVSMGQMKSQQLGNFNKLHYLLNMQGINQWELSKIVHHV